ncbi:translocation/assembly module TamB domain-containing protein [Foetidibacter luteolus]|uniref:translocation/assembly module TamB domain-containing protein n=1 Tax=Foetidibacter luteolus TaxID=2608880 RepID=UPI00129B52E9|nr:translocation/assembly module TamB [Foetidibacter luteolus]
MKKFARRFFKVIGWLLISIVLLLVLVIILIQVPAVQNFARKKIVSYLQGKLHTKVEIAKLTINFPRQLIVQGIYLEDQHKDTLLAAKKVQVDIEMLKLINSKVYIGYIGLDGVTANVKRLQPDSAFNFDYVINAFTSGNVDTTTSTDTSTLQFKMGDIRLTHIRATYKDDVTGSDMSFGLDSLATRIETLNINSSLYSIPDIYLAGIKTYVRQYKPLMEPEPVAVVEAESNEPIGVNLNLKNINLHNIQADYVNDVSALKAAIRLKTFNTQIKKLDLPRLLVQVNNIQLDSNFIEVSMGKSRQAVVVKEEVKKEVVAQVNNPWRFELANLDINHNNISYNDDNIPAASKGMDFAHMAINNLVFKAGNLVFTPVSYQGNLQEFSFREKSGFELQELSTQFAYAEKEAYLKDFYLRTNQSLIRANVTAKYPSVESFTKAPGDVYLEMGLDTFLLAAQDILLLAPFTEPQLKGHTTAVINAKLQGKGQVKDITINNFALSGYGATRLQMNGNIKGLPDGRNAYYNLRLTEFNTNRNDITSLAPKNSIPNNIRIPEKMSATGFFKGKMQAFSSELKARTSSGDADVTAAVGNNYKTYDVKTSLRRVNVGYLIKQDTLVGVISLNASAKGTGHDYKKMNTLIDATLVEGRLKGYTYRNLKLKAALKNGHADIQSSIKDPNITYDLQASANIAGTYPSNVALALNLDTLDMKALHLYADTLQLRSSLTAEFASANPDSLNGTARLFNTKITMDTVTYRMDTVLLSAERNADTQTIALQSEVADMNWKGSYKLTEVATALQHTINRYYAIPGFKDTAFAPQDWKMNLLLKPASELALQFAPDLKGSDTIRGIIGYNSAANDLRLNISAPHIQLGEQAIEQAAITATTADSSLDYNVKMASAGSKSFRLYQTSLGGNVANSIVTSSLLIKDSKEKNRYHLAGRLEQAPQHGIKFTMHPDSLLLNYDQWEVARDNFIRYDSTGLLVNNFRISHQGQSLRLNSMADSATSPIEAKFDNFHIRTLTDFAEQDSLLADGVINGNAVVSNVMTSPVFTTDLTIADLSYRKDTIGTVVAKVNNETANAFAANVSIKGKGNAVVLDGKYYTGEGRMDMNLDINNLDLSTLKGFSAGQLKDAGGSLKGKIAIAGTTKEPAINGSLRFANAFLVPTMLGEKFTLSNEEILVNNEGIDFNQFTMVDANGNKAILDGTIGTTDYTFFKFNLGLKAKNFRLINATQTDNPLFYGKLNMDADVKLGGNSYIPKVTASFRANKETDFTFVLPTSDPEVVSREGVVNFVDMDAPVDSAALAAQDTLPAYPMFANMDVDATIETDTAAAFTIVVDERNGDALKVKGKADLAGGFDESGKMTLTGNYQVTNGSYKVTLSLLKREFTIQRGSTMTWTGDPMTANVDITALYQVNASPIDLMQTQISSGKRDDLNRYKQKIPVQVFLKMKGELLKPIISFDVDLSEETAAQWRLVDEKLDQLRTNESELNKQVFALLLFSRFMQENPMETATDKTSTATMLKQSVSRILADQLNQLAGSLIQGVDLNFGINSEDDYSTGQQQSRTDLTVGVSKSLLSDRLRVSVGSNFELEGPRNSNQQASNIAGDVAVDYQLSRDGRYMIRGYRKNKYEGVVEGQVIETGLSFIFTLDYDQFRELFNKTKKKKEKKKK